MTVQMPRLPKTGVRNRRSDTVDRTISLTVWLAGTLSILFLKALHFRQLIVTTVPVALMSAYALYIWFAPREHIRDDRAGDGLYYLGFLYTMTSLAYSLYEFGGSDSDTGSIIVNFGVALSTTIVGMAARVMFHQMRENPVEIEREARIEIASYVSRLRTELLQAIEDFATLRRAAVQNTADTLQDVTKQTYERLSESATQHQQLAQEVLRDLRETADVLKQHSTLTNRATKRTIDALDKLSERLAKSELPLDLLKSQFTDLAKSFSEVVKNEVEASDSQKRGLATLEEVIRGLQVTTNGISVQVSAVLQSFEKERDAMQAAIQNVTSAAVAIRDGMTEVTASSKKSVNEQIDVLRQLSSSADEQLGLVRQHRKAIQEELEASRAATESVHSSLTSLASFVTRNVNGR